MSVERFGILGVIIVAVAAFTFTVTHFARTPIHVGLAARPSTTPVPPPTSIPSPTPTPTPVSWLTRTTLLTVYGRAFNTAPILGRLGFDSSFADLQRQVQPFLQGIRANNGSQGTRVALHLIYGMATPCYEARNCLNYLDDSGVNIVKSYIQPAARRGWLVILDDQLGSSDPAAEVRRIISRGYLRFDNVEVGLDAEFRSVPGQPVPGIPVGSVTAPEINRAADLLNRYTVAHHLRHHKVLLVHQFQWQMIAQRNLLRKDFPDLDLAIIADGFGTPGIKTHVYSDLLSRPTSPNILWRGIKLFYPNPYEQAGHLDDPLMTWQEVFGHAPVYDGNGRYFVRPMPNIIVIA